MGSTTLEWVKSIEEKFKDTVKSGGAITYEEFSELFGNDEVCIYIYIYYTDIPTE